MATWTVVLVLAIAGVEWVRAFPALPDLGRITRAVVTNAFYVGFVVLGALVTIRRLLFRFADKDI